MAATAGGAATPSVGFIGAGQMAEALARGLIAKNVVKAADIYATDPMPERKEVFRSFGATAVDTNAEVGQGGGTRAAGGRRAGGQAGGGRAVGQLQRQPRGRPHPRAHTHSSSRRW